MQASSSNNSSSSSPNVMQIRSSALVVTLGPTTSEPLHERQRISLTKECLKNATINHYRKAVALHGSEETEGNEVIGDIKIGARIGGLLFQNFNHTKSLMLLDSSRPFCCNLLVQLSITLILLAHSSSGQLQTLPLSQTLINSGANQTPLTLQPQSSSQLPMPPFAPKPETPMATQSGWPGSSTNLEAPFAMHQRFSHGPGVDLVALNQRRFELDHQHHGGSSSETDLKRGELIESYLASVPDRLLASLPENMDRQILDTLTENLSGGSGASGGPSPSVTESDEPDGASIERLTKSCLRVHASSARPEQLNVTFHLFTEKNPHSPYIILPQITRQELIKGTPFDPSKPIKWITHGFHTNLDKSEWMVEAKDKILAHEDSNVILTDWRRGASPALAFYPKAAANAHVVAKMIVKILHRLRGDIDFSRVHLIGHSLGAHIMGFVGSAFTEEYLYEKQQVLAKESNRKRPHWREIIEPRSTDQLIGRITACDPALPCFGPSSSSPAGPAITPGGTMPAAATTTAELVFGDASDWTPSMWTHLRPDSAVVVEVMHSNPGVMGYADPLGDYDFYPNGLERQPGCGGQTETDPTHLKRSKRQSTISGLFGNLFGVNSRLSASSSSRNQDAGTSRFTSTLDRLIKPIRDFFNGYTCSHHRSVEYMLESMYSERVPPERELDSNFVCQLVGYRCQNYESFKRGFCFKCNSPLDCRVFTMPMSSQLQSSDWGHTQTLASQFAGALASSARALKPLEQHQFHRNKFIVNASNYMANLQLLNNATGQQQHFKRVLPTFNHYNQNYLPQIKNQYFFDTRSTKDYCTHHYHLYIKYRWFRVRGSVTIDGFQLIGNLANVSHFNGATFNRYTYQSYTMLLTEPAFLGQIESLVLFGDNMMYNFIDYIEISYLSNLDPKVRAFGSARLCRQNMENNSQGFSVINSALDFAPSSKFKNSSAANRFTSCPGGALVV